MLSALMYSLELTIDIKSYKKKENLSQPVSETYRICFEKCVQVWSQYISNYRLESPRLFDSRLFYGVWYWYWPNNY